MTKFIKIFLEDKLTIKKQRNWNNFQSPKGIVLTLAGVRGSHPPLHPISGVEGEARAKEMG